MADRGSVFSNARVIELAKRCVPVADEVWRLQRGADADCLYFQRAVTGGGRITGEGSFQGIYVLAPSGKLLSRINSLDAERVAGAIERGLLAWSELPEDERWLAPGALSETRHRWEDSYPAEGLVLERIARELGPDDAPTPRWNRDFAWFSADEIAALVPSDAVSGQTFALPDFFVERLARFHLVDNVRGQTLPYAPGELELARLEARVVRRTGDEVELSLRGATRADSQGTWLLGDNLWKPQVEEAHSIETHLAGRMVVNADAARVTGLELVGRGRFSGRTQFNGRRREAKRSGTIGFHFSIAPPDRRIAPTFIALYDVPWVVRPESVGLRTAR